MLTIFPYIICSVFLLVINYTDFKSYRIKNAAVLPMLVIGLVLGLVGQSFPAHLYGMLLPLILFPLYALKMLGAGDIKAFCAIGAVMGVSFVIRTMLFSFLCGGVLAAVFMLCNRIFAERFRCLWEYVKQCFSLGKFLPYAYGKSEKSVFRFSYAISLGFVAACLNQQFHLI